MLTKLVVPEGLDFANLGLEREPVSRRLRFLPAPLAEMCRSNALNAQSVLESEDLSCWLIAQWYLAHREAGGEPDPVAEHILKECATEVAVPDSLTPNRTEQTRVKHNLPYFTNPDDEMIELLDDIRVNQPDLYRKLKNWD